MPGISTKVHEHFRPVNHLIEFTAAISALMLFSSSTLAETIVLPQVGGSLDAPPTCHVLESSVHDHPLQYPAHLVEKGITGSAIIHVALKAASPATGAKVAAEDFDTLVVSNLQIKKSTRNRELDRIAMNTVREWRYSCPIGIPEDQRWARAEAIMDPSVLPIRPPEPRSAVSFFPEWQQTIMFGASGQGKRMRDDDRMSKGTVAALRARIEADTRFKKDELPKPFTMYASWNNGRRHADIWWFFTQQDADATNAAVLIQEGYATDEYRYAIRCEAAETACSHLEAFIERVMRAWYPLAQWE